jgi:hypothetical protein
MVRQSSSPTSNIESLSPHQNQEGRTTVELKSSKHWTAESINNFTYRIAADFLAQVETKIENGDISRSELAQRLDRTPGRVSQLFNNPGNNNGPVNSEIFYRCWEHMGAPKTFFEFTSSTAPVGNYFNAYRLNCNSAEGTTYISTTDDSRGLFSSNAAMVVAWNNVLGHQGMGSATQYGTSGIICDAINPSSFIGMKAVATAMPSTQEYIQPYS